ncbi:dTDP-glucose 4,6-dehydratase [Synechococcus sp. PCC 6717]|jgi:dTDP-glucose 4,6-dehydratase|uniref:dTDP-glucose 4,6-dehydratase n=1 Tax=Parathermosynechococcus lividus PCC 6715 TaxID=1917166 RepID=A0A2D2PZ44_PARLV|nr:dTDP-glucose 4,6-dehydratase [Thermostichus lividus]ATS17526.1 dTDP-glucose 4,6-dehydratase [Thermostichus lividus PCC 6715]MCI3280384.1 dTDP-glucose 4,6-dehydratase [Synechococcus sp. PCC 6717]
MIKFLVTGGGGFIGANFVRLALTEGWGAVLNLDKMTYACHPGTLAMLRRYPNYQFVHGDVGDRALVADLLQTIQPDAVIHFAAESHVDRSINSPQDFIQTNVVGTANLLEEVKAYWQQRPSREQDTFRFIHISTDEVYGSLGPTDPPFRENTPYAPNSPYAASKAASDHLVRAYHHTYGLPTLTTNCSNNYGPYQFPEKLIPLMICQALAQQPLPIYGDGQNVRDWLYVEDHCRAVYRVWQKGQPGQTYNIGGNCEKTNLEVVQTLCDLLQTRYPQPNVNYHSLITFVGDRPGHDRRYAIDASKIQQELGWQPQETFTSGLTKTVEWYLSHQDWVQAVRTADYSAWLASHYGSTLSAPH